MPSFCTQLRAGYEQAGCNSQTGLLIAVSGGADSVALLHGTLETWPHQQRRLVVGHMNHGLRGDESASDAAFVQHAAQQLALEVITKTVNVAATAAETGETIEESARRQRYEFLNSLARQRSCTCVVTAHHQRDQAETVLHHLIRGTGLSGLRGMPFRRSLSAEVSLVRPMLNIAPSAVREYLRERGLEFCEDLTNHDSSFTRNRIRNELLPYLSADFNPQIERCLTSLSRQAADTIDCLDSFAEEILDNALLELQPDSCRLNVVRLRQSPVALVRHALTGLWRRQNWPRRRMNFQHWDDLATAIIAAGPDSKDLPDGFRFERKAELLHIYRSGS